MKHKALILCFKWLVTPLKSHFSSVAIFSVELLRPSSQDVKVIIYFFVINDSVSNY